MTGTDTLFVIAAVAVFSPGLALIIGIGITIFTITSNRSTPQ